MQRAGRPWSSSRAVSFRVPIVKFLRSSLLALGTFSFVGRSVKTYSSSSEFCAEGQGEAEPPTWRDVRIGKRWPRAENGVCIFLLMVEKEMMIFHDT